IIIPPIIFNGIAYSDPGSGNNPGGTRYTGYGFEVRKNGVLIASRETKGAIPGIRDERESVGNQRRILKNGCRIVRQFGGV
ncbi:hypothetical protein SNB01_01480, partial [Escherichia coli]|nr:hypothetical protein [Escherichia coli]